MELSARREDSQEFDDGSPSGPSSTRVEGTTDSVCGRYVRIHSYWIIQQKYEALGVLESKWDPIRKNLARRLIEEQDKVLRSYFAQKGGTRGRGGTWVTARAGTCPLRHVCVRKARADRDRATKS